MKSQNASPKMSRAQAKLFWKSLTPQQRKDFNKMMLQLEAKKLQLTHVTVDDNEQIQRIVLDQKDKPGKPAAPFYSHMPKIITPPEK
jgi:hypothetical protein